MAGIYHINKIYFDNPLNFNGIKIYQIGRLYCNTDTVIPTHLHTDLYELTVVTDGNGTVYTNDIPTIVQAGDIYFSHPFDSHRIESDGKTALKFDFIAFTCEREALRKEIESIAEQYHSAQCRVFRDDNIRYIMGNAITEICGERIYSKELLQSFFEQILIYLIRGFKSIMPANHSQTVTDAELLCLRLTNYIDIHIYTIKNLEELSRFSGYSYSYLSSLFKKITGNTISDYYIKKKLDIARLLILEKRLKITEIAEKLNYSSVYSLSKAFTHHYGISPRKYYEKYSKDQKDNEIKIFY